MRASPLVFMAVGLLLLWVVFTGRASAVWDALTRGTAPGTQPAGGGGRAL